MELYLLLELYLLVVSEEKLEQLMEPGANKNRSKIIKVHKNTKKLYQRCSYEAWK